MILQTKCCKPQEGVNQSVISNDRQECLFVIKRVSSYYFRCTIWYLNCSQDWIGNDSIQSNKAKLVRRSTGALYYPLHFTRLSSYYGIRHRRSVPQCVYDIS